MEREGFVIPIYCFTSDDGETFEVAFPMGACPSRVQVNDKIAYRNRAEENIRCTVKGSKTPVKRGKATWPMEPCVASGVQPDQAQELRDFYKNHGMTVEVNGEGDPIYTSAKQREKALKIRGMYDKSSFN